VVQPLNAHLFISITIWAHPLGVALDVVEGTQERRTFSKETVELRIVETVQMIRKVCLLLIL